jgi:hypothetical protein
MSAVKTSFPTVKGWIKLSQDTREGIHGDEARESIDRKSKSGEFQFSLCRGLYGGNQWPGRGILLHRALSQESG